MREKARLVPVRGCTATRSNRIARWISRSPEVGVQGNTCSAARSTRVRESHLSKDSSQTDRDKDSCVLFLEGSWRRESGFTAEVAVGRGVVSVSCGLRFVPAQRARNASEGFFVLCLSLALRARSRSALFRWNPHDARKLTPPAARHAPADNGRACPAPPRRARRARGRLCSIAHDRPDPADTRGDTACRNSPVPGPAHTGPRVRNVNCRA